jgi:hypothetical protein
MMSLAFTACQSEFEPLPEIDEEQTIMANSTTAKLIRDTSTNDGSYDNIVDGASCLAIRFPYTVQVNGVEITIDSKEDLHAIEEIFDSLEDDEDILDIIFPVTVTMGDYAEVVINGIEDLRKLAEECIEGGNDDDIECIDFVYPVTLYTFDVNVQQTGSVTVDSDLEMRRFFSELGENDLISVDFPISLKLYDGTEVQVNSNSELVNAIEMAKDACDEDDDNDHNDDDFDQERLESLLTECPWLINEVQRDDVNQTDQYFEYLMNFTEEGTVTVVDRAGNSLTGSWSTRLAEQHVLLKLEFDVLVDFNLEWLVYELEEGVIKLYAEGGNKIIMESTCDLFNTEPNTLREILEECSWIIKKVKVDDEEIRRLLGFEFNFMAQGVVTLTKGDAISQGTWEITTNAQGRLVMAIVMGDEPGVSFEWPLTDLRDDRLKFEIPGTDYELILQRVCDDNNSDGDVVEIRNVMMAGEWLVAKYTQGDTDETDNYLAYSFDFQTDHMIAVTTSPTGPTAPGVWRVIRNSDGKLKVYLNLGEEDPLGELTDDWDFVSITDNRVELTDISGEGSTSTLVFEQK